jgi:hypothetical protein
MLFSFALLPLLAPGEVIEIRSPNAIAAARGTVLVVEVEPMQPGQSSPARRRRRPPACISSTARST